MIIKIPDNHFVAWDFMLVLILFTV